MTTPTLPIQPIITDKDGRPRFKKNTLVDYLLEKGGINLNDLCDVSCPPDERQQFAQLIGYSLSGYGELSYVDAIAYETACGVAASVDTRDAKILVLQERLSRIQKALREPMAELFDVHPDDLMSEEE
jgi:hypothetical protein